MASTNVLDQAIAKLESSYTLWAEHDDQISDDQITALLTVEGVSDATQGLYDYVDERADFEFREELKRITEELEDEFEEMDLNFHEFWNSDCEDHLKEAFNDRISNDLIADLAANTRNVLFRVVLRHCDNSFTRDDDHNSPTLEILEAFGWAATEHNIREITDAVDNAPTDLIGVAVLFAADLNNLYNDSKTITVKNPYVVVGNEQTGGYGVIAEIEGTYTFDRERLTTDEDAIGYGADDVYGLVKSAFVCDVVTV